MRAFKYYTVSILTFLGNIFLAWLLVYYGGIQYIIATTLGFLFQTLMAFFVNKKWTFHKVKFPIFKPVIKFLISKKIIHPKNNLPKSILITTIVQILVFLFVIAGTTIGINTFQWSFIFSRILAGIIAGFLSYCMDSYFTFKTIPFR
ncbi:MAG TPA: GtrA family protein [bacterium]|jgi:putative flippase GtrA|nr:GtrA family protein [bacterium]